MSQRNDPPLLVLIDSSALVRVVLSSPNPSRAVDVVFGAALARVFHLLMPPSCGPRLQTRFGAVRPWPTTRRGAYPFVAVTVSYSSGSASGKAA